MDCPCGGEKSSQWHYRHGIVVCEEARVKRNQVEKVWRDRTPRAERRNPNKKRVYGKRARWTPGTDIVIPEFDPL